MRYLFGDGEEFGILEAADVANLTPLLNGQLHKWQSTLEEYIPESRKKFYEMQIYKWEIIVSLVGSIEKEFRITEDQKKDFFERAAKSLGLVCFESSFMENLSNERAEVVQKKLEAFSGNKETLDDVAQAYRMSALTLAIFMSESNISFLSTDGFRSRSKELSSEISNLMESAQGIKAIASEAANNIAEVKFDKYPEAMNFMSELSKDLAEFKERSSKEFKNHDYNLNKKFEKYQSLLDSKTIGKTLERPVKLWNLDAKAHGRRAYIGGALAVLIAILTSIFVSSVASRAYAIAEKTIHGENSAIASLVFASVCTLVFLTFAIWTVRIAVRFYMMEQHLKNDCRNRAVITDAYIKLEKTMKLTDNDRTALLQSIMRPTQDGIVQDDGLPQGHPAALLVQLIDPKKAAT